MADWEHDAEKPLFSLESLSWAAKPTPRVLHWLLQGSTGSLRYLTFLRCPKYDLLWDLLNRHGGNLWSLRLCVDGALSKQELGNLQLQQSCPYLREILFNDSLLPAVLLHLPRTVQHLAFRPSTHTLTWHGMQAWLTGRENLRVLSLTGKILTPLRGPSGEFEPTGESCEISDTVGRWALACASAGARLVITGAGQSFFCVECLSFLLHCRSVVLISFCPFQKEGSIRQGLSKSGLEHQQIPMRTWASR